MIIDEYMKDLTLTGSRVIVGATNSDSDWDYFCSAEVAKKIKNKVMSAGIKFVDLCDIYETDIDEFESNEDIVGAGELNIKFSDCGRTINIIGLKEGKYKRWALATKALVLFYNNSSFKDIVMERDNRVAIFKLFCDELEV